MFGYIRAYSEDNRMNEKVVAAYIQFREIQEEKFGIPFKDHLLFNLSLIHISEPTRPY